MIIYMSFIDYFINAMSHIFSNTHSPNNKNVLWNWKVSYIANHYTEDKRFAFISYDHISSNETVKENDISELPHEEYEVEICILCLAMWGSNCEDYIKEAYRVLETGGRLYIAEPTKRWTPKDDLGGIIEGKEAEKLKQLLMNNGFKIVEENVAKFCYFECVK